MRPIRARTVVIAWLIVFFPWLPGVPLNRILPDVPYAYVLDANIAAIYALVAFSLVLLTGWVGQISLGQGSFVGIGAFLTGLLARSWDLPFPANLPVVAIVTGLVASLLGLVALRVRGLYLAVATLIFAWMADAWLFTAEWFVGSSGASSIENKVIGREGTYTVFDLTNERVFYLIAIAAVGAVWYALVNLRDSKTGRAFFAIRGSEMAAVSLGIDVTRYKLLSFALSGAIAGIAGNLMMTHVRAATPVVFQFTTSLFYLGIAVVGGIGSLGGAVAAGVLFAALSEVFYRVEFLTGWLDVVTVGLLLAVLLGYPGGLGALGTAVSSRSGGLGALVRRGPRALRHRGVGADGDLEVLDDEDDRDRDEERAHRLRSRIPIKLPALPRRKVRPTVVRRSINLADVRPGMPEITEEELEAANGVEPIDWRTADVKDFPLPPRREDRTPILEARDVIVQFGGLTAVDNVNVVVREHEITALIGPNGAGKTTTFNAIAGLNEPTSGIVKLYGEDVTALPVHMRAQMGVGRTFQLIQLFPQLTVFDNMLVATHVHNPTGVFSHLAMTGKAVWAEAEARRRVRLVAELLGLEEYVDRKVAGLPFGVLRQVEIARALVSEAPLLMLDEPASGLDNAETDELAQLLYYVRAELGVTILLIEHDVRLVTSVSDYIYVINRGKPLAEGTAGEIQRNPDVIAAYLGEPAGAADEPEVAGTPAATR